MITKTRKKKNTGEISQNQVILSFFVIIFLFMGGLLLFSNLEMIQRKKELLSRAEALEKEIASLEKRNEELKAGIASMPGESYLEKEAREKFQLKKPGEKVVTVLPSEEASEPVSEKPRNFFERILEKLGF
jgi:cell division protein FtsB